MSMTRIVKATNDDQLQICKLLRYAVFVQEQGIALVDEIDGYDELRPDVTHYILYYGDSAVATLRMVDYYGIAKFGRICVLEPFRGLGLGYELMQGVERDARERGFVKAIISAQEHAVPFYEKCGYTKKDGRVYLDVDIPHVDMDKDL